jgi:hypothetical protein
MREFRRFVAWGRDAATTADGGLGAPPPPAVAPSGSGIVNATSALDFTIPDAESTSSRRTR